MNAARIGHTVDPLDRKILLLSFYTLYSIVPTWGFLSSKIISSCILIIIKCKKGDLEDTLMLVQELLFIAGRSYRL